MTEILCPHCDAHNFLPEDDFDTTCGACGDDLNRTPDFDDEDTEGDVYEVAGGLEVVTPTGPWALHDEEVMKLITGLSTMLHSRLTRPWSNEDDSSILTRGRATRRLQEKYGDHVKFDLETEAMAREIRRPAGTDTELANIADHQ